MSWFDSKEINSGYLTKSPPQQNGGKFQLKSWHRRWFVLNSFQEEHLKVSVDISVRSNLDYYKDKKAWLQGKARKGSIALSNVVDAYVCSILPNTLKVKVPKRVYYLKADSEEERDEWLKCIIISLRRTKMAIRFQFYNKKRTPITDFQSRLQAKRAYEAEDVPERPVFTSARQLKRYSKSLDCLASKSTTPEDEIHMNEAPCLHAVEADDDNDDDEEDDDDDVFSITQGYEIKKSDNQSSNAKTIKKPPRKSGRYVLTTPK